MTRKILVTGSEGFTGRYVTDLFRKQGYEVAGLVHRDPGPNEIACDLLDPGRVREVIRAVRPDGIIHLAALAFVKEDNPEAYYSVNIFGALNILEALDREGATSTRVIVASSANVYGDPGDIAINEKVVPGPVNHYAASKLAMEYMVKTWFPRMPILITRPFNYTGPGQSPRFLAPKIVDHFRQKAGIIELGNLDVVREFSDVRDVAAIYLRLFESDVHSEIVNICTGKAYRLLDLIEIMKTIAGRSIVVQQNPRFMRDNEIKVLRGDPGRLEEITGYRPCFSLRETLRDMFNA